MVRDIFLKRPVDSGKGRRLYNPHNDGGTAAGERKTRLWVLRKNRWTRRREATRTATNGSALAASHFGWRKPSVLWQSNRKKEKRRRRGPCGLPVSGLEVERDFGGTTFIKLASRLDVRDDVRMTVCLGLVNT